MIKISLPIIAGVFLANCFTAMTRELDSQNVASLELNVSQPISEQVSSALTTVGLEEAAKITESLEKSPVAVKVNGRSSRGASPSPKARAKASSDAVRNSLEAAKAAVSEKSNQESRSNAGSVAGSRASSQDSSVVQKRGCLNCLSPKSPGKPKSSLEEAIKEQSLAQVSQPEVAALSREVQKVEVQVETKEVDQKDAI